MSTSTLPKSIPPGSKVYKDECMYSFDTADNNALGLDVCLNCFQAYSRSNVNFTKHHFAASGHRYYLNIVKTVKPEPERVQKDKENHERQTKMAKLEVKLVDEHDLYNTTLQVYDVKEDKLMAIDDVNEEMKSLCHQVLAHNSSHREEEIKTWEQEIVACAHSIDIEQINTKVDLTKCSQCELKENLWICLHCGALGCGRQQYGSTTPGNSHALSHYEVSNHPVAIKLGSLSGRDRDNYDAYCYQCNDEVKVPKLEQYLQRYGIDFNKSEKTEKNLVELNLDQNLNWQFQLEAEDGGKLTPVFGSNLTGLSNLGNSCYLNSVVQGLFHLLPYESYFGQQKFPDYAQVPNPATDLLSQLIKLHDGLVSGRYSRSNPIKGEEFQLGLKPQMFKSLIGAGHGEFSSGRQQDAFEFLVYLLDKVDNQFGFEVNKPLKFVMVNLIQCKKCYNVKRNQELVDNISVNIEDEVIGEKDGVKQYKQVNIYDSFKNHCDAETIDGYHCDNCNDKTTAAKTTKFRSFPDFLVVNTKRIKLENWVPIKVDVPVELPENLDLSDMKIDLNEEEKTALDSAEPQSKEEPFKANQEALDMLLGMGFPEPRSIKALFKTGNGDAESAMNWLFAHMEDPDIDEPLDTESSGSNDVDEGQIANFVLMGFTPELSKKALAMTSDANEAVEWLFNNPDDDGIIPEGSPKVSVPELINDLCQKEMAANYRLKSVVCHKGSSPHTGHYVAFIRIGEKWVMFNDEKVMEVENCEEDVKKTGYISFWERVSRS